MQIRDRIKELRRVRTRGLLPNPRNWRQHPDSQADALRGVLAEIGFADAVLASETPEGLMLLDGHLRAEVAPDANIPVLVLDVTPQEGDMILASHDPLAAMAQANAEKFQELLDDLEANSPAVEAMFQQLAEANGIFSVAEADMPELPAGGRTTPSTMNFTLVADQVETVKAALAKAKEMGPFVVTGN